MFIDNFLNVVLRPFRELYAQWMRIRGIKGGIQGDIRRIGHLGHQAKHHSEYAYNAVAGAPGRLNQAMQFGQPQQQQSYSPPPQAQPSKKKMSWSFPWSKKTCPRCSNKLHKSWDQCPYCGLNQNNPAASPPMPAQPPGPGGAPGQPPGMQPQPYGQPPGMQQYGQAPGMPQYGQPGFGPQLTPGGPQKTIAMDAAAIDAPLMGTGDRGDNVAWLVPLEGAMTGELLQVKGKAVIGTAEDCHIRLFDAAISSRHAEIVIGAQNRFRVNDLGSRNGTYVNDKQIASVELVDGDNIRLGRTTFRFKTKN